MSKFNRLQLRVEGMVRAQGSMKLAGELIYRTPGLDDEERAALWLLAWSLLPEERQESAQQIARERLRALTNVQGG